MIDPEIVNNLSSVLKELKDKGKGDTTVMMFNPDHSGKRDLDPFYGGVVKTADDWCLEYRI